MLTNLGVILFSITFNTEQIWLLQSKCMKLSCTLFIPSRIVCSWWRWLRSSLYCSSSSVLRLKSRIIPKVDGKYTYNYCLQLEDNLLQFMKEPYISSIITLSNFKLPCTYEVTLIIPGLILYAWQVYEIQLWLPLLQYSKNSRDTQCQKDSRNRSLWGDSHRKRDVRGREGTNEAIISSAWA